MLTKQLIPFLLVNIFFFFVCFCILVPTFNELKIKTIYHFKQLTPTLNQNQNGKKITGSSKIETKKKYQVALFIGFPTDVFLCLSSCSSLKWLTKNKIKLKCFNYKKYVNSRTDEKVDLVSDGTRLKFSGSGFKNLGSGWLKASYTIVLYRCFNDL